MISAPNKDINREAIASITITGLSKRISNGNVKKITKVLLDAVQELSEMLGYKGKNIL